MCNTEQLNLLKNTLYDKSRTCPLCNHKFTSKAIRVGKNKLVSLDEDLYAHYDIVNPILYDAIVCPECKYSATSKNFDTLMPRHKLLLKDTFNKGIINITLNEYLTAEDSIAMHKLALLAAITKKSKIGEQAYIALHIAWLYRECGNKEDELLFLERAYSGFNEALSTENFPIQGFDEATLMYTLAALAHQLDKDDECLKMLSSVITMSGLSPRLKDHALNLKEKIKHK